MTALRQKYWSIATMMGFAQSAFKLGALAGLVFLYSPAFAQTTINTINGPVEVTATLGGNSAVKAAPTPSALKSDQAILYSGGDNMPLPAPSTYSANTVFIQEAASGPTPYTGPLLAGAAATVYQLDTTAAATRLVYRGNTTADYDDPAQLTAVLTVVGNGAPIPGATVLFTVGTQSCSAATNTSGLASCTLVLNQPTGDYEVTATFGGSFGSFAGTSASKQFDVTLEECTLTYTGHTVIPKGGPAHMSGVLLEDNTSR